MSLFLLAYSAGNRATKKKRINWCQISLLIGFQAPVRSPCTSPKPPYHYTHYYTNTCSECTHIITIFIPTKYQPWVSLKSLLYSKSCYPFDQLLHTSFDIGWAFVRDCNDLDIKSKETATHPCTVIYSRVKCVPEHVSVLVQSCWFTSSQLTYPYKVIW